MTTSLLSLIACASLALGAATQLQAAEKKNDPAGTWTWTMQRGGGEPRKMTLTLKADGEKLTGAVTSPGRDGGEPRETAIADGKVKGDEISFTVTREFNNNKMVQKFSGKVEGDTIKGKIEFDRDGETRSRDWEAKRAEVKK